MGEKTNGGTDPPTDPPADPTHTGPDCNKIGPLCKKIVSVLAVIGVVRILGKACGFFRDSTPPRPAEKSRDATTSWWFWGKSEESEDTLWDHPCPASDARESWWSYLWPWGKSEEEQFWPCPDPKPVDPEQSGGFLSWLNPLTWLSKVWNGFCIPFR